MLRIPVMLAKCGIDSGICDKECAVVEVEEHSGNHTVNSVDNRKSAKFHSKIR